MSKIFISSHGKFASGLLSSLEFFAGDLSNKVTVFDAYLDDRSVEEELNRFFSEIGSDEQVILLSDLYGGSVNQAMIKYLERPNTFLIAGINLALALELVVSNETLSKNQIIDLVESGRAALRFVELDTIMKIEEVEDFF